MSRVHTLALLSWFLALCTLVLVPLFVARSRLEEEILIRHFGAAYSSYAARVPMLIPRRCVTAEARERPSDASEPQTIATASWAAAPDDGHPLPGPRRAAGFAAESTARAGSRREPPATASRSGTGLLRA